MYFHMNIGIITKLNISHNQISGVLYCILLKNQKSKCGYYHHSRNNTETKSVF